MAEIKKKIIPFCSCVYANCSAAAAGRIGSMGALPRTFPLCGRGGKRSPLPGRISKQNKPEQGSHGIKIATGALEIAVSYALQSS